MMLCDTGVSQTEQTGTLALSLRVELSSRLENRDAR
jgi:hypothetical protein